MATQSYFSSKPVSDWQANGPAESGHNFIDQINQQQGTINEQQGRYNTQYGNIAQAQGAYDEAYKGQQNYGDLYAQAKQSEGVNEAQNQYQRSLDAVNATRSAMNTLPSSINANSNVVLTNAQRQAALGHQMDKYQNTLGYWTGQNAGDLSQYQTALGAAQNLAQGNLQQQQTKVSQSMQNLQSQMDMANKLYDQVINERSLMRQIYGQMYDDEYRHMQEEIEAWAKNLAAETQRYQADASERAANSWQNYMDALNNQQAEIDNTPTFLDYVNSEENLGRYGEDYTYDQKKALAQQLALNYQNALRNGNAQDLSNIYSGEVYKDYLNYLGR